MHRILFLRNQIDTPERYNYEISYGWVERGIEENLYEAFDWYVDLIPHVYEFNQYLQKNRITAIISLTAAPRFAYFKALEWVNILKYVSVPSILLACDSCYHSWDDPFYQAWDFILYKMGDRDYLYPRNGAFIPWCINMKKYRPVFGGEDIKMIASANKAYELREALRLLNRRNNQIRGELLFDDLSNRIGEMHGERYIQEVQSARALITTGSRISPPTRAKVLEAASCGTLVITPPTQCLEMYFSEEQVFVFKNGKEFREICGYVKNINMDDVVEKQKAVYEYTRHHHNCIKFIKRYILPAIAALKMNKRRPDGLMDSSFHSDFSSQSKSQFAEPSVI